LLHFVVSTAYVMQKFPAAEKRLLKASMAEKLKDATGTRPACSAAKSSQEQQADL